MSLRDDLWELRSSLLLVQFTPSKKSVKHFQTVKLWRRRRIDHTLGGIFIAILLSFSLEDSSGTVVWWFNMTTVQQFQFRSLAIFIFHARQDQYVPAVGLIVLIVFSYFHRTKVPTLSSPFYLLIIKSSWQVHLDANAVSHPKYFLHPSIINFFLLYVFSSHRT